MGGNCTQSWETIRSTRELYAVLGNYTQFWENLRNHGETQYVETERRPEVSVECDK